MDSEIELQSENIIDESVATRPVQFEKTCVKQKLKRCQVCNCFKEYSSQTSIHGIQYITESNRPLLERMFWIIVIISSILGCSVTIYNLWMKWENSPVILTFNERETEIWKIPFPAITICPQVKVGRSKFDIKEALHRINGLNDTEWEYLKVIAEVCDLENNLFYDTSGLFNESSSNVVDTLKKLAPDIEFNIFLTNKMKPSPMITWEGICYNINGLRLSDIYDDKCELPHVNYIDLKGTDWNRENGYKEDSGINAYPKRVISAGMSVGMFVAMSMPNEEVNNVCKIPVDGYKVFVHSPDTIPTLEDFFILPANKILTAGITPDMIWTSQELRNYSPKTRRCFFSGERKLKYFKIYTEENCKIECFTTFVFQTCKCVPYFSPRFKNMKICQSAMERACYNKVDEKFMAVGEDKKKSGLTMDDCRCLPACTSITYRIETSHTDFRIGLNYHSKINETRRTDVNIEMLNVYLKEDFFLSKKRSELYGTSEFIANCGGLLGLFMGISLISFIELFYYSTIRIYGNYAIRKYNKRI